MKTTHPRRSELVWFGDFDPSVAADFSARIETAITPVESGAHRLSLVSAGLSRLFVNGAMIIDNWSSQRPGDAYFGAGSDEAIGTRGADRSGVPVVADGRIQARWRGRRSPVFASVSHRRRTCDDIAAARRAAAAADAPLSSSA